MKRPVSLLILFPIIPIVLSSCLIPGPPPAGELTLVSWNVQNLFDGVSSGGEYEEYDPGCSDWDESKMRIKMEHLQELLLALDKDLPDILLLQEVENREVLRRLNKDYLEDYYSFAEAWKDGESAICCGILSRLTPLEVHLHYPGRYGKRELRPLTELHFDLEGERLVLFNMHWKSRSGGRAATEEGRIMASLLLASRIRELREAGHRLILAAGDLNGSAEDYRSGGSQTAQMPVEELGAAAWADGIFVSGNDRDCALSDGVVLFSPWREMERESGCRGSYFYQNRWMKLDHFLMDSGLLDGRGWEFEACRCGALPLMQDELGRPLAWESWRCAGYSDHFPLILTLRREK